MEEGIFALMGLSVLFMIWLPLAILMIVSYWKIFTKAGKPGWACLIPIYNTIVLLQIIGKSWAWIFLFIIPVVNIVFLIWATNLFAKSFGKDEGYTVGLIFLSIIFIPIIGLGSSKYIGPAGDPNFRNQSFQ